MELKYVPPPAILSRQYYRRVWNCSFISGDDDELPGSIEKSSWVFFTHPRDRRRQFLKDIILYVCPKDINLSPPDKDRLESLCNPFVPDRDFTVEIGDYVAGLLKHTRTLKVHQGSMLDYSNGNVFTEKTIRISVRKQLQVMNIDNLEYLMFFLVHICWICSNLITKAQLGLIAVVIEEAVKHMTNHSDKFQGYEELQKYASQKLIDCVETRNSIFKEYFIEPFR